MKEEAKLLLRLRTEIFDLKAEIDLLRRIKEGNCTLIEDLDDFMLKEKMMLDKDEDGAKAVRDARELEFILQPNTVKAALEREHVGFEGFKAPPSSIKVEQGAIPKYKCGVCQTMINSSTDLEHQKCILTHCHGTYSKEVLDNKE